MNKMKTDTNRIIARDYRPLLIKNFRYDFPKENLGVGDKYILGLIINEIATQFVKRGVIPFVLPFYAGVLKEMQGFGYSPDITHRLSQESDRWSGKKK